MSERMFRFLYGIHLTPWEEKEPAAELVEMVEGNGNQEPLKPGRALDIGCGTGLHTVYLAERGWEAVGVDFTPKAIMAAKERARKAGVSPRLVVGNAAHPERLGIGQDFSLLLDRGCLHSLQHDLRPGYVRAVTEVAALDALLLILACYPSRAPWPKPVGLTREEVTDRFAKGWRLERSEDRERGHVGYHVLRRVE